jgi:glycosyltransferase involved in cell wall biosynthesis
MKIAVNTRLLLRDRLEGIGWFTAETLRRITVSHPEHQFFFLFDRPFSDEFIFSGNITPIVVPPQSRHPLLWYQWFEYSVPAVLNKIGAELFLSPDGYLSLSTRTPSLPVIHDINFMHFPGFHPCLTGKYYRHFFPRFARKAKRIATVSNFSAKDISATFGIPGDKIDIVLNGAGDAFTPLDEKEKAEARNEFAGGHEYFIFVGSLHQRKNICGLLDTYESFREKTGMEIKLVLRGGKMHDYRQMDRVLRAMRFKNDVIFTGRMQPAELRRAYGGAVALVYIPWYEGFGIPVLEAMNCDTPVIVSNRSSLPEIAGDAAHVADPSDRSTVVDGMIKIVSDLNYRESLIDRARIRRKQFSWDKTAGLLWDSIEKTLQVK